jgi:type IV secretory pathway VirB10-like protein
MRIDGGEGTIVRQGKFLDCVLINELRVDLAESPVMAMVNREFLDAEGKRVLFPSGTRALGAAGVVGNLQQARVYIRFDRVVFPDGRTAYFPKRGMRAIDAVGAVGVPGDVDRHVFMQFGAAVMLGVLDGLGAAVRSPVGEAGVQDLMLARTSNNFSTVLAGVIGRYANVVPTITVERGTKMKVFFDADVRLSTYMSADDLSWMKEEP